MGDIAYRQEEEKSRYDAENRSRQAWNVQIPDATHLFEEPGTLEKVAHLAAEWFERHLVADMAA